MKKNIILPFFLLMIISASVVLGYTLSYSLPMLGAMSGPQNQISGVVYLEVSDSAREKLYALWDSHMDREYSACARGYSYMQTKNDSGAYEKIILRITDIHSSKTGETNNAPIIFCAGELGVIHNHPNSKCTDKLWTGDVQAAKLSFAAGNELFLIQCQRDQLEVYSRENLYSGRVIRFG